MTISVVRPKKPSPKPSPEPAAEGRPTTQLRRRDRYLDSLRALALVDVLTYHVFGWVWLPILFPSMGILFALAGSLVASSLDRSPGNPWRVLKKRTIRLLPPLWLFGLVTIPIMLVVGWAYSRTAGAPLSWQTLLFWVLPISDPPGSRFGADWVAPLWFIRSYLWFLLLSPATLWLFRHWPKRMMAIPITVILLSAVGLLPLDGRSGDVILSLAMFGGCWMLGFAHHDNKIRATPLAQVLAGGVALMALGLAWAFTHPDSASTASVVSALDIDNVPVAETLYSLGAVLLLLRLNPDLSWLDRRETLDKLVSVLNSRAMTIYLWGNVAIFLSRPLLHRWTLTKNLDLGSTLGNVLIYAASWVILIGLVLAFGWCEDVAARRPAQLNPWPHSTQQLETMRTRKVLTFPRPSWLPDLTPRRLLLVTSCLLASAVLLSAAALSGTHTPGRTTIADTPSRFAVNPRPDAVPPANLGAGRNRALAEVPSLTGEAKTGTAGTRRSRVQPLATAGAPIAREAFTPLSFSGAGPLTGRATSAGKGLVKVTSKTPAKPKPKVVAKPKVVTKPKPPATTPPKTVPPATTPPATVPPTLPPVTTPPATAPPTTPPPTTAPPSTTAPALSATTSST